ILPVCTGHRDAVIRSCHIDADRYVRSLPRHEDYEKYGYDHGHDNSKTVEINRADDWRRSRTFLRHEDTQSKSSRCSADLFCRSAGCLHWARKSRGPIEQVRATPPMVNRPAMLSPAYRACPAMKA